MLYSKLKTAIMLVAIIALGGCATAPKGNDIHLNSVKVTNMAQNHGGTGIVLRSSDSNSIVLTNDHVCGVIENGGLVSGPEGNFMVTGYKKSQIHDLCLIRVSGNLGANTAIASRPPRLYYEDVSISGHPGLMPNVITRGRYSGKDIASILAGVKPCTDADTSDPMKALVCGLLGGLPIIKQFPATIVSATSQPGSSGSGVYNSDNELSGVVFAGEGQFSYAWTVPYEYMRNFLFEEQQTLQFQVPTNEIDPFGGGDEARKNVAAYTERLKKVCHTGSREKIKELCALADVDLIK